MKRLLHRDDLKPAGPVLVVRITPCEFDRRFIGLRAAVAKKDLVGK
jgi:hypothetical protein